MKFTAVPHGGDCLYLLKWADFYVGCVCISLSRGCVVTEGCELSEPQCPCVWCSCLRFLAVCLTFRFTLTPIFFLYALSASNLLLGDDLLSHQCTCCHFHSSSLPLLFIYLLQFTFSLCQHWIIENKHKVKQRIMWMEPCSELLWNIWGKNPPIEKLTIISSTWKSEPCLTMAGFLGLDWNSWWICRQINITITWATLSTLTTAFSSSKETPRQANTETISPVHLLPFGHAWTTSLVPKSLKPTHMVPYDAEEKRLCSGSPWSS